jgi:hypothetical protein
MSETQSRSYPVRETMAFQRRSWMIQRVGWVVLALIALAGLAGLTGPGLLSDSTAGSPALSAQYQRFQRETKLTRFIVRLPGGGEPRLKLGHEFQTSYEISDVQPQPSRSDAGADGLTWQFDPVPGVLVVVIWARPRQFGPVTVDLQGGDARLTLRCFVYP